MSELVPVSMIWGMNVLGNVTVDLERDAVIVQRLVFDSPSSLRSLASRLWSVANRIEEGASCGRLPAGAAEPPIDTPARTLL